MPGRPIAYRTTDTFLRCFGLNSLENLPPIPGSTDQIDFDEYEEMTGFGEDSEDVSADTAVDTSE